MTTPTKNLPTDPDGMNEDRAAWAGAALETFTAINPVDEEDALADLLADLMHWADRNGQDFSDQLARAQRNYESETTADTD